jgi:hypothetical protein
MFQTEIFRENQNTLFTFNKFAQKVFMSNDFFPPKIAPFVRYGVEKYGTALTGHK